MAIAGEIAYKITIDTKDLKAGLKESETAVEKSAKKQQEAMKKAGEGISKAFKVGAVAAGTALTAITTMAVKSYADYQQLTGGVETLFKSSADTVMQYAEQAYKTAGLSANEYMETITGFSASLIQSLGGDTAKAAEVGNRAVQDMSDNANKMGTSIESIQFAYQGFAKQNYTMLDNLKLGYGGTKTEMERLIKDAAKMTDIQKDLNVTVDEGDLSFANIVNAISVMQKNLDITGTTAKEADKTISGSFNSMKAAWNNFATALSDPNGDVSGALDTLMDSIGVFLDNLLPAISETVGNIFNTLWERAPILTTIAIAIGAIAGAVWALNTAQAAWKAITEACAVAQGIFNAVMNASPIFWIITGITAVIAVIALLITHTEEVGEIFKNVMNTLIEAAGKAWEGIQSIFGGLADFFKTIFTNAWTAVKNVFSTGGKIFDGIKEGIVKAFKTIVNGIIDGINKVVSIPFNAINGVLDGIRGINILGVTPFTWIGRIDVPQIPHLATGGIVPHTAGGQIITAGEAGEDEWVVPESKMADMIAKLNESRTPTGNNITIQASGIWATNQQQKREVAMDIYKAIQDINKTRFGALGEI